MTDTIFAVSSGAPPAAIGVIRMSGPKAGQAVFDLVGRELEPRRASLAELRGPSGEVLDQALVLWFPGPDTATGEDLAEFHCHGGRAVLAAVEAALGELDGARPAEPGEFTRRAFANGRIDLAESEGLADLLTAETELQRASAIANASGALSKKVEAWRSELLTLSAQIESALDFSDEDDVGDLPDSFTWNIERLLGEIEEWLVRPRSEALGEGVRVAIAGPPNAGKSTLFNTLVESEAAITSPIAGTTRDLIERSVDIAGVPFTLIDTAGLRDLSSDAAADPIEVIGIDRARSALADANIVLWLGEEGRGPSGAWEVSSKADVDGFAPKTGAATYVVSAATGEGLNELKIDLVNEARSILPKPSQATLNMRQHRRLGEAAEALKAAVSLRDLLLIGEELRRARVAFDRLVGRSTTEDMLDALFGRFCIGK
ncbi:tRNA uridine-5-carboxymethylaminomethyl(34) synthesis GTPase MnmE [Erythrobacter rubeus]|uniref:tRNA modification GTPase MnmE n=1 Tax=Erythrobacter rubeus TaxID=2760803 RepID=A0ABR8KXP1_9SPHN|nr:tRNA uridine-5-carboxymethylaminomethyl(34) synthesis GTPase MnmE [Erythrobacter rubeus]MBD2843214.1 tRNA uridine-5-carboxymethylaminomethyl(34) synthesis GTPase MnmE [Erythrobacter rubeus]